MPATTLNSAKLPTSDSKDFPWYFWTLCFLVLAIARYQLGGNATVQQTIHQITVDSILAGNNWGRQALVGSIDTPLLPTLTLLTSSLFCKYVPLDSGLLLCAVSQALVFTFFLNLTMTRQRWILAGCLLVVPFCVPLTRHLLMLLDPSWFTAVLGAAAVFYLMNWQESNELRDLLIGAVSVALFAFSGPAPLVMALILVPILAEQYRLKQGTPWEANRGIRSLLWLPLIYCIVLWFLWNSLIFNDMLFGLRDMTCRTTTRVKHPMLPFDVYATLALLVTFVILSAKTEQKWVARCLLPATLVIPATAYVSAQYGIGPAGLAPLALVLFMAAAVMVFLAAPESRTVKIVLCVAFACSVALACVFGKATTNYEVSINLEDFEEKTRPGEVLDAPKAEDILSFIDQYWPDSRVVLIGSRLPALYPDPQARRFIAKLDFSEEAFVAQAAQEQLYILIPPPDGRFYPRQNSLLADIHANGRDWLFLEKVYPNNWQLWRSTVPPLGESRLLREKQ